MAIGKAVIPPRTTGADASSRAGFKEGQLRYSSSPASLPLCAPIEQRKGEANRWLSERVYESTNLPPYSTYSSTRAAPPAKTENVNLTRTRCTPRSPRISLAELMGLQESEFGSQATRIAVPHRYIDPISVMHVRVRHSLLPRLSQGEWHFAELYHASRRRWQQSKFTEEERFARLVIEPDARADSRSANLPLHHRDDRSAFIYPDAGYHGRCVHVRIR